jgi:hypothetical protein
LRNEPSGDRPDDLFYADLATAKEAGLTKQEIAETRRIRDAEKRDPGAQ